MYFIGCFLTSALFFAASILKLKDIESFSQGVASFDLFPPQFISLITHAVPFLELLCAVLILFPYLRRPALLNLTLLSISFIIIYAITIQQGIQPDCGCFGPYFKVTPKQGLARSIAFTILTLGTYIASYKPKPPLKS